MKTLEPLEVSGLYAERFKISKIPEQPNVWFTIRLLGPLKFRRPELGL